MTAALAGIFIGYAIGSYGWVLLQGYDITFRQWITPLHAWDWSSNPGKNSIPADSFLPSSAGQATAGG